jgi:hypothetical protein
MPEEGANGGTPTPLSRFGFRQQKFVERLTDGQLYGTGGLEQIIT